MSKFTQTSLIVMPLVFSMSVTAQTVEKKTETKRTSKVEYATTDLARESSYEIDDVKRGSVYEKLGLQKGDVIMSINGKPVAGPNEMLAMNSAFSALKPLTVIFAREGKTQTLRVHPTK